MAHETRTTVRISTSLLAQELCVEAHALVGESGQFVLLEVLSRRLAVNWDQLRQAVAFAEHKGWIEVRPDSIALAKANGATNGHGAIDGALPRSNQWPPAIHAK